ncbi:hypothetical protein BamMEX5DRAFT_4495 [Burkholderia ambifaria MEX-5]|uniref:Uncharacterized protein n=1 Tax=Burkholderia ambifaria MEX-5 TaxID=396597 RepID=B1T9M9_9BURK|nr:hypothetical protein BamMEX5DRAFT_4495 [Burkholderia ambifaria MEX-5]
MRRRSDSYEIGVESMGREGNRMKRYEEFTFMD